MYMYTYMYNVVCIYHVTRGISHPHSLPSNEIFFTVTSLAMVNHYRSVVDEQSAADEDEHEGVLLSGSDSEDDLDTE